MTDRWSRTTTPDGQALFEETDMERALELARDGDFRMKSMGRQKGRDAKGRFRSGPLDLVDEDAIARYSAESDIAGNQQSDDDLLERYLRGDLVDHWIPIL
jgi:hypothetical protein